MSDLAEFYRLTKTVNANEAEIYRLKAELDEHYARLVQICPHSEAADNPSNLRGMGTRRVCKICGVTDYASEGGTRGDEYDYGYPGSPSKSFWKDANVEVIKEDVVWSGYSRSHQWVVKNGKAEKRFG